MHQQLPATHVSNLGGQLVQILLRLVEEVRDGIEAHILCVALLPLHGERTAHAQHTERERF